MKFCFFLLFSRVRGLLRSVGTELAEAGRLRVAEDIFFLTLPEARAALEGRELRPTVSERRAVLEPGEVLASPSTDSGDLCPMVSRSAQREHVV
ncbi:MAG: hypothetical protein M3Q49_20100 [Actinomycetota bacterium]|nr:hypothetical protein [Actinomycetota bacterium]